MRAFLGVGCLAGAVFLGTASWAATVQPLQGELYLNEGGGFQRVESPTEARVGDSVMVSPDGAATLSYPDGCIVNVHPGAVNTVAPLSPCASGSVAQEQYQLNNPAPWIAAGLFVAGIATVGTVLATQSHPASP